MGKRSDFERRERDFYPTPPEAVAPLLAHLPDDLQYWEPCAGDGALIEYLDDMIGCACIAASDLEPSGVGIGKMDALSATCDHIDGCSHIITNPPWDRKILHPMIEHFSAMRPTWLLFDADWVHTKQAAPFLPWLRKIVSVGRVKWIPDSKMTGKDNCAWHLFDQCDTAPNGEPYGPTEFWGRR